MTLTLLNEWVELQDIDCPPHLRPKRIIDRRGIETHRCITPPDSDVEIYSEDMEHLGWGKGSVTLFTPEFLTPNAGYFEKLQKDIFSKTRALLENSDFSDREGLLSVWSKYSDSNSIDAHLDKANWVSGNMNSPPAKYFQGRDSDLVTELSAIADSRGLKEVVEELKMEGMILDWQRSAKSEGAKRLSESVDSLKNGEVTTEEDKKVKQLMDIEQGIWRDIIGDGTMRVYRGVSLLEGETPDIGKTVAIDNTLSSWTVSPAKAGIFGNVVLARTISVDDIVASFFSLNYGHSLNEGELILHTPEEGVEVDAIKVSPGLKSRF